MAINSNSFFQYNETRAQSGYKSAWLVKLPAATKYSLLCATESVPYVFGDNETFEFDLLQSPTKGQVTGKPSLEAQDVEVLHHRDNAYRFMKLEGETLDFLVINSEFVGYKFTGTIVYKPNSAEADVSKATVTITPMSASVTPVLNARDLIEETLMFKNAISESIALTETVDLSVVQSSAMVQYNAVLITGENNAETPATGVITTDPTKVSFTTGGLYAITATATGYAPWTTTIFVENN